MKNALAFLLLISALLSSCIKYKTDPPPEPHYYYFATYEYMLDEGSLSTKVNGMIFRDTVSTRQGEWNPPIGTFTVNNAIINYSTPGYDWQVGGYTDGNVVFDSPGRTHFDHNFSSSDSLFNRLPAGTDTININNFHVDIGTDSILHDEYLILFITQGSASGKIYFTYDSQTGTYRTGLSQTDDIVYGGPATVQLSRRRHSDPTSIVGGTTVHCVYECRSEFVNVVIFP